MAKLSAVPKPCLAVILKGFCLPLWLRRLDASSITAWGVQEAADPRHAQTKVSLPLKIKTIFKKNIQSKD